MSAASNVPSARAPSRTRAWSPGRPGLASRSVSRVLARRTGRPGNRIASSAASGSSMMPALPPKPPPIGAARTTIRRSGSPSARARRLRTSNGDCVELSISSRPSGPHSAMATRGSKAT